MHNMFKATSITVHLKQSDVCKQRYVLKSEDWHLNIFLYTNLIESTITTTSVRLPT